MDLQCWAMTVNISKTEVPGIDHGELEFEDQLFDHIQH